MAYHGFAVSDTISSCSCFILLELRSKTHGRWLNCTWQGPIWNRRLSYFSGFSKVLVDFATYLLLLLFLAKYYIRTASSNIALFKSSAYKRSCLIVVFKESSETQRRLFLTYVLSFGFLLYYSTLFGKRCVGKSTLGSDNILLRSPIT